MVQLGLMPPPPPKVKLSNMMRVMGDQAVLTPSEIERKVREETEKRKQNHAMRNVAGCALHVPCDAHATPMTRGPRPSRLRHCRHSKLTPEERREKWRSKFEEGEAEEIDMALYRVNDLGDTLHRFKIDKNAQYMQLTGRVILCTTQRCNMVLVEGGPWLAPAAVPPLPARGDGRVTLPCPRGAVPAGIRKFNKLMLRRIRWNERSADLDAEERGEEVPTRPNNQCHLVWRGSASRRAFLGFRFIEAANSEEARRALEPNGAGPYWDMVEQYDPEAHEGLDVL